MVNKDKTITRKYKVVRVHNGKAAILDSVLNEDGTLTFYTDKFSTYAIAYTDVRNVTSVTATIDKDKLTSVGETAQITVTVNPNNATDKSVTFKSSNDKVVTVDANGKVTVVGDGTATITVTTVDGGLTAKLDVKVDIQADDNNDSKPADHAKPEKPSDKVPATGDNSKPFVWAFLAVSSATGLVMFGRKRKASNDEK